jgi:hypothetical protein
MDFCHGRLTVTFHGRDRSQKRCALSRLYKYSAVTQSCARHLFLAIHCQGRRDTKL